MKTELLKKITLSNLGANLELAKKESVVVARIFGRASTVKVVTGKFSGEPEHGFIGEFYAQVPEQPGVQFQAGVCWLPEVATAPLYNAMYTGEVNDKGKPVYNELEFAFDLIAKPHDSEIGYQFSATPLTDVQPTDVLTRFQSSLPEMVTREPVAAIANETKTESKAKK